MDKFDSKNKSVYSKSNSCNLSQPSSNFRELAKNLGGIEHSDYREDLVRGDTTETVVMPEVFYQALASAVDELNSKRLSTSYSISNKEVLEDGRVKAKLSLQGNPNSIPLKADLYYRALVHLRQNTSFECEP